MIDEPDDVLDFQVARHIVNVHQKRDQAFTAPYSMTQIQRYIKFARSLKPRMTPEVRPSKKNCLAGYTEPQLWSLAPVAYNISLLVMVYLAMQALYYIQDSSLVISLSMPSLSRFIMITHTLSQTSISLTLT